MTQPRRRARSAAGWSASGLATGLVTGLIAVLVVAGCTSGKARPRPTPTSTAATTPVPVATPSVSAAPIQFSDCTTQLAAGLPRNQADRVNRLVFSCGRLPVPITYDNPYGQTIDLYVVRVHDSSQSNYQGSLVVNPGGPGVSGVNLAVNLGLQVSLDVLDHFDLIGFDPRGVFLSNPVQCITNAEKDALAVAHPDVRSAAGLAQAAARYTRINTGCGTKLSGALQDFNTEYTARDMDLIRQGTRDETMNFLGYSAYGTRLGAAYAHLFPAQVRTMVLDGAVDPAASEVVASSRRAAALEQAFDRFAGDCAQRTECRPIGAVRAAVTALTARADRVPIPTTKSGDRRRATGTTVLTALRAALPDQTQWATLAAAILAAQRGDARALFSLADAYTQRSEDGTYSNQLDAGTAVTCNDSSPTLPDNQIQATARTWAVKYPLFGISQAADLLRCRSWPATRHPVPPATAPASAPILVLGTAHDPAAPSAGATTANAGAAAMARTLGSGTELIWDGDGPTAYPRTPCVTEAVNDYLIDQQVPAAATTCPAK